MKITRSIVTTVDTDKIQLIAYEKDLTIKIVDYNKEYYGIELFYQQVGNEFYDFWWTININGILFDVNYDHEYKSSAMYEVIKDGETSKADVSNPIKIETIIVE